MSTALVRPLSPWVFAHRGLRMLNGRLKSNSMFPADRRGTVVYPSLLSHFCMPTMVVSQLLSGGFVRSDSFR